MPLKSFTLAHSAPLLAVAVILGTSFSGNAATMWSDFDRGAPLDFLHEKWGKHDSHYDHSYSRTWDLGEKCEDLSDLCITDIQVWFAFADDQPGKYSNSPDGQGGDAPEYVDISLGGIKIWDDLQVDGSHRGGYAYYSMILDPIAHSMIFDDLADDGRLSYTVELQQKQKDHGDANWYREDTYLKVAGIKAWCEHKQVPDSGTSLALLGMSLAGLGLLKRKLAS
jgi:hypothetical protein